MILYENLKSDIAPIQKCFDFLSNSELPAAEESVDIGDGIYCVGCSYDTIPEKEAFWEGHRKYTDLHCVLSGEEKIGVASLSMCKVEAYDADRDFFVAEAVSEKWVTIKPNTALCLFPDDVHKVKVQVQKGTPVSLKKIVFKIPVEMF